MRLGCIAVAAGAALLAAGWFVTAVSAAGEAVGTGEAGWAGLPAGTVATAGTLAEAAGSAVDSRSGATADATAAAASSKVVVDPGWLQRVADATGIPPRALRAYASADLTLAAEQPQCGLGWNTIAAIGAIESDHGRHGGAALSEAGYPVPAIRGPALDGDGVAAIRDTDRGVWDGDEVWDRAVGPMQFIPDTWTRWGADGDGDAVADPNQIDDAALAAAHYLCGANSMTDDAGWRAAVFSYNHLESYVDDVAGIANRYAASAG